MMISIRGGNRQEGIGIRGQKGGTREEGVDIIF